MKMAPPETLDPFKLKRQSLGFGIWAPRQTLTLLSCCQGDRGAKELDSGLCLALAAIGYVISILAVGVWACGASPLPQRPALGTEAASLAFERPSQWSWLGCLGPHSLTFSRCAGSLESSTK